MRNRLVQQVVAEYGWFVLVPGRKTAPERDGFLLRLRAFEQPRVAPTVVDIGAGLSPRCGVKIEDRIEAGFAAPLDRAVEVLESWAVLFEERVVQRYTNRVEPCLADELDIFASDVCVAPFAPERISGFGTDQLAE